VRWFRWKKGQIRKASGVLGLESAVLAFVQKTKGWQKKLPAFF